MDAQYIWIIVGIALLIGEIFSMDFSLACFGAAAIGAGLGAWLGLGLTGQVILFSLLSLIMFLAVKKHLTAWLKKSAPAVKSNADALLGRVAKVTERIDPAAGTGRVKIDGDDWKVNADFTAEVNEDVTVDAVDGAVLTVSKK